MKASPHASEVGTRTHLAPCLDDGRPAPTTPPRLSLTRTRAGITLIEIIIVLVIMASMSMLALVAVTGSAHDRVSAEAMRLSGAIRMIYGRAAINGIRYQLVMDLDEHVYWVECTLEDIPIPARTSTSRDTRRDDPESDPFGLGTSAPTMDDCTEDLLPRRSLREGVRFDRVLTVHDERPVEYGTTTIAFFPNGFVEPSIIWLSDRDETTYMTLTIDAMTGRVRARGGNHEIPDDFFEVDEDR